MRFVILGLLLSGPLSLYDVRKRFTAGISLFYSASFGSIQRALKQLVDVGAVTVHAVTYSARGKRLYQVTDDGRRSWRDWMLEPIPPGQEAETTILAKVFLLGRLDLAADRVAVLEAAKACAGRELASLQALASELDSIAATVPEQHRATFGYQRATLDYGVRAQRLRDAWLDHLLQVSS